MEEKKVKAKHNPPTSRGDDYVTEPQKVFCKEYAATGNAKESALKAYPTTKYPAQMGLALKKKAWIQDYIVHNCKKCAEIQMEMIEDRDLSPAVRMDGIKDVLNRAGIGKEEEEQG